MLNSMNIRHKHYSETKKKKKQKLKVRVCVCESMKKRAKAHFSVEKLLVFVRFTSCIMRKSGEDQHCWPARGQPGDSHGDRDRDRDSDRDSDRDDFDIY